MAKKVKTRKTVLTYKEQADICLYCPLPAEKCDTVNCERFRLETKRLKENKRKWVEKKLQKSILTS